MITTHFSTYRRQYHLLRVLFLCLLLLAVASNRSFAKDGQEGDDSASSENSGSGNSGSGNSDDNSGSGSSDDNSGSGHDDGDKPEDAQPTPVPPAPTSPPPPPTATLAPTEAPTNTPAPTATAVPTNSPTPVPTATLAPTVAPTNTPPPTATAVPTNSPTPIPTATSAPTVAPTNTPAPTATAVPTNSPTPIPTAAAMPTVAPTTAPSNTPAPTATIAPTNSPTALPTVAPVHTNTPQAPATRLSVATVAATHTTAATATAVPTKSATAVRTNTPQPVPTLGATTATALPTRGRLNATSTATHLPTQSVAEVSVLSPQSMNSATATHSPTAQSLALAFSLKRLMFTATPSPLPTTATKPDSTSPIGTNPASGGSGVASQSLPIATPGHSATAAPQTSNVSTSNVSISNAAINDNSTVAAASAADQGNVATASKGTAAAIAIGNFLTEFLLGIGGVLGAIALYLALVFGWRRVWKRGSQQRKAFSGWMNPWLALKNLRQGSQSTSHLRTIILNHLWRTKGSIALAAAGVLGTTFSELLNPWPLKLIFDYVLLHKNLPDSFAFLERWFAGNSFWLLVALVAAYGLLTAISNGFSFLESYITSRVGLELVTTLRRELFVHLQRLSLSFHAQSQRGELLNQVSSDTQALREAFAEIGLTLITNLLTIIGMCVVMFFINWRLSIIPLISVPTLFIVYYKMQQNLKETATKQRKTEGQIVAQLSENLAIMPVVQAFGRERDEVRRFDSANLQNLAKGVYLARLSATISRSISSISSLGLLAVVFYGAWLALNNQMTPGDVLLFVSYVKSMYKPIRDAVKLSSKLTKAYVSAQRIDEILSTKLDIEDKPDAIVARKLRGEIRFSHVNFGYDNNRQILHDLSFQIEQGERVAFVGASGAGKSTLTNLLLRLYEPQSGEISIDGLDIRDYMRDSLRHRIGLVLQEAFLMRGTIGENIAYGKLSATPAEIERAARQAHIHNFIMTLPNGYNTMIGELGNTLSGGQRQRIAIARALIKDPSILILDEPTSALDAESKQQVQETIEQLQRGKTILCIAHQLSTVENFDKIIVMDKGRIVEQGTHHELLQRQGAYARLHRLQHAPSTSNVQQGYLFPDALAVMT